MEDLIIDPEFRDIIPPLTDSEFEQLEKNILADGEVIDPIITWNNTILDGHHRWKVVQAHPDIPYKVKEKAFEDRDEAIIWICMTQRGRRNMNNATMDILMGEAHEVMKRRAGRKLKVTEDFSSLKNKNQNDSNSFAHESNKESQKLTREKLAEQFGVSPVSVERAAQFYEGVKIAEEISPGFEADIKSGDIKVPKDIMQNLPKVPVEKREKVMNEINKTKEAKDAKERKQHIENARNYLEVTKTIDETLPHFSISLYKGMLDKSLEGIDNLLNRPLVQLHPEMLETEEGREAARDALKRAHKIISTYETEVVGTYEQN